MKDLLAKSIYSYYTRNVIVKTSDRNFQSLKVCFDSRAYFSTIGENLVSKLQLKRIDLNKSVNISARAKIISQGKFKVKSYVLITAFSCDGLYAFQPIVAFVIKKSSHTGLTFGARDFEKSLVADNTFKLQNRTQFHWYDLYADKLLPAKRQAKIALQNYKSTKSISKCHQAMLVELKKRLISVRSSVDSCCIPITQLSWYSFLPQINKMLKLSLSKMLLQNKSHYNVPLRGGGLHISKISGEELARAIKKSANIDETKYYTLHSHSVSQIETHNINLLHFKVPLHILEFCNKMALLEIIQQHGIYVGQRSSKATIMEAIKEHECAQLSCCQNAVTIFQKTDEKCKQNIRISSQSSVTFPPEPSSKTLTEKIVKDYYNDLSPENIREEGCAVCGVLTQEKRLIDIDQKLFDFDLLKDISGTCTRVARKSDSERIRSISEPVLDPDCSKICRICYKSLKKGKVPNSALVNGNWIGKIPQELQELTFVEKLMIARVRHNACIVKVEKSGQYKMRANVICFESPIPKLYHTLPPKKSELDEIVAYLFIGPNQPSEEDHTRTPLLVNKDRVLRALEWLKLNHCDYADLSISKKNLDEYPENVPPFVINYRRKNIEQPSPESLASNREEEKEGCDNGEVPFIVHTMTANELDQRRANFDFSGLKKEALDHLIKGNSAIGIGRSQEPVPTFNNPQQYPQAFPWLFPYGLGGIGNSNGSQKSLSHKERIKSLLMYHDKRFQLDKYFPLMVMNQTQVKAACTGGTLLTKKGNFAYIAERLMHVDINILTEMQERMSKGEHVSPQTDAEKLCYNIIHDIDYIAYHIDNSLTGKKKYEK